jgi:hypothetical protein
VQKYGTGLQNLSQESGRLRLTVSAPKVLFRPGRECSELTTELPVAISSRTHLGSGFERWTERHLRVLMLAPAMHVLLALTIFP